MTLRTLTLAAAGLVGLAGCDAVVDAPPSTPPSADAKLRHWDLQTPDGPALANARTSSGDVDFVVTFQSHVSDPEAAADRAFCGQDLRRRSYFRDANSGVAGTVPAAELDGLLDCLVADPDVKFVEPDLPIPSPDEATRYVPLNKDWAGKVDDEYKFDEEAKEQVLPWNIEKIKGNDSSARSGNGSGSVDVDVFVIDTDIDHPEVDVVNRRSFLPAGARAASTTHGNHVALTIAARDDRRGMVGVAPGARIHALSVFDASGGAPMSRLIEAVDHVAAWKKANPSKPAVLNMSVGAYLGTTATNALDEAVQKLIEIGVPVVVSAGNHKVNAALVSPAHVPDAITVGAYDGDLAFSRHFSNYGSLVDILAPGDQVVSGAADGKYALMSGTSMAAPHVTGAVALYLARNPRASAREASEQVVRKGKGGEIDNLRGGTTSRTVWLEYL